MDAIFLIIVSVLAVSQFILIRKTHRGFTYMSTAIAKLATAIVVKEKTPAK